MEWYKRQFSNFPCSISNLHFTSRITGYASVNIGVLRLSPYILTPEREQVECTLTWSPQESCKENGNGLTGNSNTQQRVIVQHQQAMNPQTTASQRGEAHNERGRQPGANNISCHQHAISDFGELQRCYRTQLFGDTSLQWFIYVMDNVHGPYSSSQLLGWSQKDSLPRDYKLAAVPAEGPKPEDVSAFTDFMDLLQRIHIGNSFRSQ